jgi:DNA-directed RNA polymerase specialized sigma subunit
MKEILIIGIVIILVIYASICSQNYLRSTSNTILEHMQELRSEIERAQEDNKTEKAVKLSNEIYDEWQKTIKNWSILVVHEELDEIELSLLALRASVQSNSLDDALQEVDKAIFLIGHIAEKESFKLKNLF